MVDTRRQRQRAEIEEHTPDPVPDTSCFTKLAVPSQADGCVTWRHYDQEDLLLVRTSGRGCDDAAGSSSEASENQELQMVSSQNSAVRSCEDAARWTPGCSELHSLAAAKGGRGSRIDGISLIDGNAAAAEPLAPSEVSPEHDTFEDHSSKNRPTVARLRCPDSEDFERSNPSDRDSRRLHHSRAPSRSFHEFPICFGFFLFCISLMLCSHVVTMYFDPYVFLDDVDSLLIRKASETDLQTSAPVNQLVPVTDLPGSIRMLDHPQKRQEEEWEDVALKNLSELSQISIEALERVRSSRSTGNSNSSSSSSSNSNSNSSSISNSNSNSIINSNSSSREVTTPIDLRSKNSRLQQRPLPFSTPNYDTLAGKSPKIAFLFLTRGPLPLRPLWEEFFHGNMDRASVYVHAAMEGFNVNSYVGNTSVFWGTQIPGLRTLRGMPSMIQTTRRLLASALQDRNNQRFVLVSEACIPIRSFNFIYQYLFTGTRSFLAVLPTLRWWRFPRYFWIFMPRQVLHPWQLKKGSQWFVLTRPHAALVVEDIKYYVTFGRGRGEYPDESYIQTVVWGYDRRGIEPHSVMHVEWPAFNSEHPTLYTGTSTTRQIIERMQRRTIPVSEAVSLKDVSFPSPCRVAGELAPCFLLARKFSADSVDALMVIRDTLGY